MTAEANIRLAMASGLSMVCATCRKWHEAADRGMQKCLAVDDCGSPIVGDTFHEYEGPITDFLRFCFVCGGKSTKGLRVKGHARKIGVCDDHAGYVVEMAPKEPRRLPVLPSTILADGGEKPVETLIPKPRKTLGQLIHSIQTNTFKPDD